MTDGLDGYSHYMELAGGFQPQRHVLVFFICVFIYLLVWNDGLQNGKCFLLGYSLLILAITTKQVRQCHLPRQSQATRIAKAQADAWKH